VKLSCLVLVLLLLTGLLLSPGSLSTVQAQTLLPVVHAVLFYSPSCPHCHQVITQELPPLFEKYDGQLDVIGIDLTQEAGQALFQATVQYFNIPQERQAVPMLIVGETILVGSLEIPERFPGLIETYLAQGGVDWPDIPGFRQAMAQPTQVEEPPTPSPQPPVESEASEPPQSAAVASTPNPDPVGIGLALSVLVGMILAVLWSVLSFFRQPPNPLHAHLRIWLIVLLSVIGLGVAGYLAYVETLQVTAACGPIGDCNAVQQSEHARLFGFLPVAWLGLIGYALLVIFSILWRVASNQSKPIISVGINSLTLFATIFSIYLTYLEIFVIRAVCSWCLSSAIISTLLLLLSVVMIPKQFRYTIKGKTSKTIPEFTGK
jgi:uncharacterized membrane protein/thiol-disulfide isomerase/thioredoxin